MSSVDIVTALGGGAAQPLRMDCLWGGCSSQAFYQIRVLARGSLPTFIRLPGLGTDAVANLR